MTNNPKTPRLLTLDADTYTALALIAAHLRAAGVPCDDGGRWGRSAACRWIVRRWEADGGLERLVEMLHESEEAQP